MNVKEYKSKFIELTNQLVEEHGFVSEIKISNVSGQVMRPKGGDHSAQFFDIIILF